MKAFARWDRQTEVQYSQWRAPSSDLHRAALVASMFLCACAGGQGTLPGITATGCLIVGKSAPGLSLLLFTVLQYLLLAQFEGSEMGLCAVYLVQVVPGVAAFPGQTLRQAALLLATSGTVLLQNWTGEVTEERLVLVLGAVLSTAVLTLTEVIYRLQFDYKDFEGRGQSALQEVVQGLGSCVLLLQPSQVLYANEATHKLLKAQTTLDLSRRLAAFQLLVPGPNLSAGRNQPLWSEVNALARKPRPGEVQLRKYVLDTELGRVVVAPSARCVKWQGETQAVVLTLEAGGSAREAEQKAVPSEELRHLHNEICASAKLAREQPSPASFDDLERCIFEQYYHIYTVQDLTDLAAGRHLNSILQSISIQEETQRLLDLFSLQSRTKRINLEVTASPSLPPFLTLDLVRLRQLLFPTLHYALNQAQEADIVHVNFSEKDGLQVSISYTSSSAGDIPDAGLQATVTLARSLGKGLRLQPGQLTFSVSCQASEGQVSNNIGNKRS